MLKKKHVEQANRGAHNKQSEKEQNDTQKNVGAAQVRDGLPIEGLLLRCLEKAFAGPVLQQIAGAQSFFGGCAVGSHASFPKRRAIRTSMMSMATPVTRK